MLYLLLKWLHVMAVIVAVGANITYGVWIARASRAQESLPFTLRGIKFIDDRLANPAYAFLLVPGLLMIFMGRWVVTTPWLAAAIILYIGVVLVGLLGFTPTLRRQIELAESEGTGSGNYQALARRGRVLGIVLGVLVAAIVFIMVVKPGN